MNIIFLLDSTYPYYTGGRETWIYNVCNRLCENNNVYVFAYKPVKDDINNGVFEDINPKVKMQAIKNLRNFSIVKPFLRSYLNILNLELSAKLMQRKLKNVLNKIPKKEKVFVITMNTIIIGKIGIWIKKHYDNVIYISSVRCPHADLMSISFPFLKKYFQKTEIKTLFAADDVWANGWDTQAWLKEKGVNSIVIKNGIDINRVKSESRKLSELTSQKGYNIITIGTLSDIKGYNELIEAIAIINKKHNVKLNLVALGKGNPNKYIELASSLGIKENVNFIGENRNTIEYAKEFDICACLSGGSGLSMACLESMSSKIPVIAWDSPVYRQMIKHKINGYLVEEKNVNALADGILWIIKNKETANKMGEEAYQTAKQFDWSYIVDDIVQRINKLMGEL